MTEPATTQAQGDAALADEFDNDSPINLQDEIFEPAPPAPAAIGNGLVGRIGAEFFGTFLLVFVGVGAALYGSILGFGQLGVALAFGIALIAGIAAVGSISGGHFNPAVTFGLTLAGRASWKDLLPYWVSQLAGGSFATLVLWAITPRQVNVLTDISSTSRAELFQNAANGFAAHSPAFDSSAADQVKQYLAQGFTADQIKEAVAAGQVTFKDSFDISWTNALILETVAVALFVGIILAVTDARTKIKFQPVVIGLSLAALLALAMPLTNGSLNPARSFATAVFAGGWTWGQLWVFIVAPLLGGAIAALFYRGFAAPNAFIGAGIVPAAQGSGDFVPFEAGITAPTSEFTDEAAVASGDQATPAGEWVLEDVIVDEVVSVDVPLTLSKTNETASADEAEASALAEDETTAANGDENDDDEPEGDTVLR
ncbi:hypothetical protein GCM10010401_16000 [Rarobacter faecitabidus]|uniref:Aquaporin Z n=2 Tax=Rarobacter faecitabidus TaxID=13243 RepID=A0A542ZXB6_RARFA|nr:aquaporin Z [Rarobacter faecitabidus]